ncbi:regulatory protein GemA [Melioribacter sp. OK-6-Me]|uniref:regulatory protein GemA n=1 Tax=unclassified Melioribacter TaxID=2627329 RepID=UPI003EDA146C
MTAAGRNIEPVTRTQIIKIHIAAKQLNLSRQQYEDILSGFIKPDGSPCTSSKDLDRNQAEYLLRIFRKLGFKETKRGRVLKYEEYSRRDYRFAEPRQMRLIDALWHTSPKVRNKTDAALNHFIKRIAGVDHIGFLLKKDVQKVIKAIREL